MKEWLAQVEQRNMPHFARGCVFGLAFWIFGMKVISFGMSPVLFSFLVMFAFSVAWEIRDQIRMVGSEPGKYDGFDWMDIFCDMLGVAVGQLWHLSTHAYDGG